MIKDDGTVVTNTIETGDINYPGLKGNKYKITPDSTSKIWTDVEDRKLFLTLS